VAETTGEPPSSHRLTAGTTRPSRWSRWANSQPEGLWADSRLKPRRWSNMQLMEHSLTRRGLNPGSRSCSGPGCLSSFPPWRPGRRSPCGGACSRAPPRSGTLRKLQEHSDGVKPGGENRRPAASRLRTHRWSCSARWGWRSGAARGSGSRAGSTWASRTGPSWGGRWSTASL